MPILEMLSEDFSRRLRSCRGAHSKADFARFLGLTAPSYHRYEAGRIPKSAILKEIARRCNTTANWLLTGTPPPGIQPPEADVEPSQGKESSMENSGAELSHLEIVALKRLPQTVAELSARVSSLEQAIVRMAAGKATGSGQ